MTTLQIPVLEFDTSWEALEHVAANPEGAAVLLDGKPVVVRREDADRLAAAGAEFAYLGEHAMADGSYRIMTIPVN